jgi:hypothetical protein
MAASASRPLHQPERFGRLWWLPAHGTGNGLTDIGWAPVADIPAVVVVRLLTELHDAGVPAHVALVTRRPVRARRRRPPAGPCYRLWVGTSAYSRAEEILRVRLPVLLERGAS